MTDQAPLRGRVALITGVSRRQGIAFAVASRLARMGADLMLTHHQAHDAAQPWGADDLTATLAELRAAAPDRRIVDLAADLALPGAPRVVMDAAQDAYDHLDILVCVHARSGGDGSLLRCDESMLDAHWSVNARSTLMLTRYFAEQFDPRLSPGGTGRAVWFTSGQQLGPMPTEVAYATSKAALAGIAQTVADELIDRGILLNVVNPGPVDTGYLSAEGNLLTAEQIEPIRARMPLGRFGHPDDPARLVAWLVSDEGGWVVGQVINSEGGFRRFG
ncbi:MAG: SDR family oxidoreductase [Actinomycetales bacterium]